MENTKFVRQAGKTKYVRIDHKTIIEVSVNTPDNIAREHYLMNRQRYNSVLKSTSEIAL